MTLTTEQLLLWTRGAMPGLQQRLDRTHAKIEQSRERLAVDARRQGDQVASAEER